ncbi:MAG: tetratricopeptide repeat protein [Sphingomonadaceae bacterium]
MKISYVALISSLFMTTMAGAQPTASPDSPTDMHRYRGCIAAIPTNAREAEDFAIQWRARGGGLPARHCQAMAQLEQERFAEASATLVEAARAAEVEKSPLAADFWGQAGNAAILAGDNKMALTYLDTAIAQAGNFSPVRTAGFHIDRARVHAEGNNLDASRVDLDKALELAPEDPLAWTLSAALARRAGDPGRATRDIARASELAPSDPDVVFEQGNIAAANGDVPAARRVWQQVVKAAPLTEAAELAKKALAESAGN